MIDFYIWITNATLFCAWYRRAKFLQRRTPDLKNYIFTFAKSAVNPLASLAFWVRQRVTLGTQIVLLSGQGVLLVRHRYKPGWHLPGGGLARFEEPAKCVARELREETGYVVIGEPALLGLYPSAAKSWISNYVAVFYSVYFETPETPTSSLEIADCQWFPVDRLPPGATSFCRAMIYVVSKSVNSAQWKQIGSSPASN